MSDIRRAKVSDLVPDARNANKGTERGLKALDHSLRTYGVGRGVVADKDLRLIGGNKTVERLVDLGIEDVVIVPTDGKTLVVTQRTDLDLEHDATARALAFADNRVGQLDLDWEVEELLAAQDERVDLAALWRQDEIDALVQAATQASGEDWSAALGGLPAGAKAPFQQMTFTVSDEQAEQVKAALDAAKKMGPFVETGNENSNGNALARVCEVFLSGRG